MGGGGGEWRWLFLWWWYYFGKMSAAWTVLLWMVPAHLVWYTKSDTHSKLSLKHWPKNVPFTFLNCIRELQDWIKPGASVTKFWSTIASLRWNNAVWLAAASHVTSLEFMTLTLGLIEDRAVASNTWGPRFKWAPLWRIYQTVNLIEKAKKRPGNVLHYY